VHPVGKTVRWIEKSITAFLMGTTPITMQSFGKIALRAPAVGPKTWYLYVFFCFLPEGCRYAANCRY